jgi:hypothetical protein
MVMFLQYIYFITCAMMDWGSRPTFFFLERNLGPYGPGPLFSWEESRPTFKPGRFLFPLPGNPYRPSARGKETSHCVARQIEPRFPSLPGRVNPLERRRREPWRGPQRPPPRPTRTAQDPPPTRAPPHRGATAAGATAATGAAAAARRARPRPRWRRARTGGPATSAAAASGSTRGGGPRRTTTATGDLMPLFPLGVSQPRVRIKGRLVIDLEGGARDPKVGTRESSLWLVLVLDSAFRSCINSFLWLLLEKTRFYAYYALGLMERFLFGWDCTRCDCYIGQ